MIGLDSVVRGEADILRYLARSSSSSFDLGYDEAGNPGAAAKTDEIVDVCHRNLVWGNGSQVGFY